MPARILDGNALAERLLAALRPRIERLAQCGRRPRLVAIRANNDHGSEFYARMQEKFCRENGIYYCLENLIDAAAPEILACIRSHNADSVSSAIMVHTPLPHGVEYQPLVAAIDPAKDAEGMHPQNLGHLLYDPDPVPSPCTASAALALVLEACPNLRGRHALVIGHSRIVGRPAALMLLAHDATVTVAHIHTRDLARHVREAEVLVVATGAAGLRWQRYRAELRAAQEQGTPRPEPCDLSPLVRADMIRPGAVVIDIGVNRIPEELDSRGEPLRDPQTGKPRMRTTGDVDFDAVRELASAITCPTGGVGPVTNATLLRNTIHAAELF